MPETDPTVVEASCSLVVAAAASETLHRPIPKRSPDPQEPHNPSLRSPRRRRRRALIWYAYGTEPGGLTPAFSRLLPPHRLRFSFTLNHM